MSQKVPFLLVFRHGIRAQVRGLESLVDYLEHVAAGDDGMNRGLEGVEGAGRRGGRGHFDRGLRKACGPRSTAAHAAAPQHVGGPQQRTGRHPLRAVIAGVGDREQHVAGRVEQEGHSRSAEGVAVAQGSLSELWTRCDYSYSIISVDLKGDVYSIFHLL